MPTNLQTLVECPQSPDGLIFATYWYRSPGIYGFRMCSCCFEEKIACSRFARSFERYWYTPSPGEQVCCSFNTGQAHQLFEDALQSGDLGPFLSFAARRSNLHPCPGTVGNSGGNGLRWYGIREIPDFMACEACFEDAVSVSSFGQYFTPYHQQQSPANIWACDIAIPFIKRCLEQYSSAQDWSGFVNASRYRLTLEQCTGEEIEVATKTWYSPTAVLRMMICETCFFDDLLLGGAEEHFTEHAQKPFHRSETARCAFSKLSVRTATNRLLEKDFQRWQRTMHRIMTLPPCGGEVHNGEFYTLVNPWTHQPTDFDMCESCFVGCVESSNMSCLFRRTQLPGTSCCEFSPLNHRYGRSVKRFTQAILTQNTSKLVDYAIRAANIYPCARDGSNTRNVCWWGTEDFVFCAECYDELGKDSCFATSFKHQGTFDARPEARCDMWSDEMRQAYLEACQKRTLTVFIPFARQWHHQDAQSRDAKAASEAQIQATRYAQAQVQQQASDEAHAEIQHEESWQKPSKLGMAVNVLAGAMNVEKKGRKRSKFGKAVKVLAGAVDVLNAVAPIMLQQQAGPQEFLDAGGDYEPHHTHENTRYDAPEVTYHTSAQDSNDVIAPQVEQTHPQGGHSMLGIFNDYMKAIKAPDPAPESAADPQAEPTQSQGGHSVLGIFNDYMNAIKEPNPAAAVQAASAPSALSTTDAVKMSQQMWAKHQMNMGMLQSNAALFGMHNAAMSGICTYGSSYNNYYDSNYQSYSSDYNAAQNNMYTGMAMASMYK